MTKTSSAANTKTDYRSYFDNRIHSKLRLVPSISNAHHKIAETVFLALFTHTSHLASIDYQYYILTYLHRSFNDNTMSLLQYVRMKSPPLEPSLPLRRHCSAQRPLPAKWQGQPRLASCQLPQSGSVGRAQPEATTGCRSHTQSPPGAEEPQDSAAAAKEGQQSSPPGRLQHNPSGINPTSPHTLLIAHLYDGHWHKRPACTLHCSAKGKQDEGSTALLLVKCCTSCRWNLQDLQLSLTKQRLVAIASVKQAFWEGGSGNWLRLHQSCVHLPSLLCISGVWSLLWGGALPPCRVTLEWKRIPVDDLICSPQACQWKHLLISVLPPRRWQGI